MTNRYISCQCGMAESMMNEYDFHPILFALTAGQGCDNLIKHYFDGTKCEQFSTISHDMERRTHEP